MSVFNHILYWFGILFGLIGSIVYWKYVWEMEDLYPIIGVFIASHGVLIGSAVHYIMQIRAHRKK